LIGSEVKDLFQNCYQPCADKDYCKKQAAGVSGQYNVVTGEWEPDDSSYPTCDRD